MRSVHPNSLREYEGYPITMCGRDSPVTQLVQSTGNVFEQVVPRVSAKTGTIDQMGGANLMHNQLSNLKITTPSCPVLHPS